MVLVGKHAQRNPDPGGFFRAGHILITIGATGLPAYLATKGISHGRETYSNIKSTYEAEVLDAETRSLAGADPSLQ